MNSQRDNAESLRRYLLGSLPEAETAVFDELSFTDDGFAARLQIAEDELVDAYVRGELSGQRLAQFQSYYLASPHRREMVRFAQAFQSFAEQKMTARTVQTIAPQSPITAIEELPVRPVMEEPATWWRKLLNLFAIPNLRLQWGLVAAAMLLLLAGGWLLFETLRLRNQVERAQTALRQREKELQAQIEQQSANAKETEQLKEDLRRTQEKLAQLEQQTLAGQQAKVQPLASLETHIVPFELAPQTRGTGRSVTLAIPPGTNYALLQLELGADDYPAYQAELRTQTDDQLIWKSGRLKVRDRNGAKIIDLSLRASLLAPRGYILKLKGITQSGAPEDLPSYAFRVVKQ